MEVLKTHSSKRRGIKCEFRMCNATKQLYPDRVFFSFPTKNRQLCDQWLANCANEMLTNLTYSQLQLRVVCARHFTRPCFSSDMGTTLEKGAVPTLLYTSDDTLLASTTSVISPSVTKPQYTSSSVANSSTFTEETNLNSASNANRIAAATTYDNSTNQTDAKTSAKTTVTNSFNDNCSKTISDPGNASTTATNITVSNATPITDAKISAETTVANSFNDSCSTIITSGNDTSATDNTVLNAIPTTTVTPTHDTIIKARIILPSKRLSANGSSLPTNSENKFNHRIVKHKTITSQHSDQSQIVEDCVFTPSENLKTYQTSSKICSNSKKPIAGNKISDPNLQTSSIATKESKLKQKVLKYKKLLRNKSVQLKRLRSRKPKISRKELFDFVSKHIESEAFKTLLKMQLLHNYKNVWEEDEKQLSLEMFCMAPVLFKDLRESKGFNLPAAKTMRGWFHETGVL